MVVHACHPSTWEAEAKGRWGTIVPRASLSQKTKKAKYAKKL